MALDQLTASCSYEELRARVENSQISVKELKEIEVNHYKPLIQKLINGKSIVELKELIIVFNDLAKLMKKLGDPSGDLVHYTDAAIVHQFILTILEEKLPDINDLQIEPYARLFELQKQIFLTIGGDLTKLSNVEEEANDYRAKLSKLRDQVKKRIKVPTMDPDETRALFEDIAEEMKNFLAKIYSDCENQMAMPSPCSYAVIGLGSMALQQITPNSDLEFAILIENEAYQSNTDAKIRNYFENLSHLAHFKVILLRETVIATSKYDVDTSHLVHRGVNFDLGGKTPLGRIDKDKPYRLIKTVDWMLEYVYNKKNKASHVDKMLPYILENVCYVYGDIELVKTYQKKVAEFLGSEKQSDPRNRLNCEIRAIKLLKKLVLEYDYCQTNVVGERLAKTSRGDLHKLQPERDLLLNEGDPLNVKLIYRLSERMIYNLGMHYNITATSGWNTIDQLCDRQFVNVEAAKNLKWVLSFVTLLRLKTYLYHKAQHESMSVHPKETISDPDNFQLSVKELSEDGEGLFRFYDSSCLLHEALEIFCAKYPGLSLEEKRVFFREFNFNNNNVETRGLVYFRLSQEQQALFCFKSELMVFGCFVTMTILHLFLVIKFINGLEAPSYAVQFTIFYVLTMLAAICGKLIFEVSYYRNSENGSKVFAQMCLKLLLTFFQIQDDFFCKQFIIELLGRLQIILKKTLYQQHEQDFGLERKFNLKKFLQQIRTSNFIPLHLIFLIGLFMFVKSIFWICGNYLLLMFLVADTLL